jgi:hypothetical protein
MEFVAIRENLRRKVHRELKASGPMASAWPI